MHEFRSEHDAGLVCVSPSRKDLQQTFHIQTPKLYVGGGRLCQDGQRKRDELRSPGSTVTCSLCPRPTTQKLVRRLEFQILAAKVIDPQLLRHHADVALGRYEYEYSMNA